MSDSNLHTCERAALGWQNDGPCKQCELEDNFAKFGGNFGGKPVPSGTQDEREREIRERFLRCELPSFTEMDYIFSLLDAERKRSAAVAVLLRAKCSDVEWEAMPKELKDVVPKRVQELEGALRKIKLDLDSVTPLLWKDESRLNGNQVWTYVPHLRVALQAMDACRAEAESLLSKEQTK